MAQILSVTQINNALKQYIDGSGYFSNICVRGEISNYKLYPSGHHYFSLKDAEGSLKCVMFRANAQRLKFAPANGMMVIAFGSVSVYQRDGVYQLYCASITPDGAGDLQVAFEQLKKKLSEEGLFEQSLKKPLPRFPKRIVLVTSPVGAAVKDMLRILNSRWPLSEVVIVPARVQGAEAPDEIAAAIAYANRYSLGDIIITGRGGGSAEDLWCFNDERVVRAIFASEIPVVSAVGHEPDITLSDYVADVRASTPSNAAEIAVPDSGEFGEYLRQVSQRLYNAVSSGIELYRQQMLRLGRSVSADALSSVLDEYRQDVDRLYERLEVSAEKSIKSGYDRLNAQLKTLSALNPCAILSRGYSIVENGLGKTVTSVGELSEGDRIKIILADGEKYASVL